MTSKELVRRPSYPPVPVERRKRESEALVPRAFRSSRRNRHLTVPLAAPPVLWATAEVARAFHVAGPVASASLVGTAAMWWLAQRKYDRPVEVWYARATCAAGCGWVSLASWLGPAGGSARVLGGLLLAGGLAWGIPYWRHKRPRGQRRRQRMLARWDGWWQHYAPAWGLAGSRVIDAAQAGVTTRLRVQLWAGHQTYDDVKSAQRRIESGLDGMVGHGMARVARVDGKPSQVDLFFKTRDPLEQEVEWDGGLAPRSVHEMAIDGLTETGNWKHTLMRINAFVIGKTRTGKALALDTPVPTPGGWTTMGALREGDIIFGRDGRPCRVTDAWEVRHGRPCYEIAFSDGSTIIADQDHQWLVDTIASRKSQSQARRRGPGLGDWRDQSHKRIRPVVTTTGGMAATLTAGGRTNYSVRVAAPLAGLPAELPIGPYTLGAWLGDGANATGSITCPDREVAAEIEAEGESVHVVPCTARERTPNLRVDGLTTRLRAMSLRHDKHIPLAYLRASEAQRRALLAGLLDTDGYCTKRGGAEYCSISERLARDVRHLAATLGYKPTLRSKPARLNGKDCGTSWTVAFTTADKVFRLPRKASRLVTAESPGNQQRYVTAIRPVPSVPVRCIAVDSPDHLFLVGETCIPTHNSNHLLVRLAQLSGCTDDRQVLIDLKGGRSARPALETGCAEYVITTVDEARMYLRMCIAEIRARAVHCYTGDEQLLATEEVPAVHTLIDETYGLTSATAGDSECARYLATLASQGSGLEFYVEVYTQYGALDESVQTEQTRMNLTLRVVYAVETPDHGSFAIADYANHDASRLRQKGAHLVKDGPEALTEQVRAPKMEHGLFREIAARNVRRLAGRRPLSLYCGGEVAIGADPENDLPAVTWQEWWDDRWARLDPRFRGFSVQYQEWADSRDDDEGATVTAAAQRPGPPPARRAPSPEAAEVAEQIAAEAARYGDVPDGPPPKGSPKLADVLAAQREALCDALMAATGGISPAQLAEESGMAESTVYVKLGRLTDAGALTKLHRGLWAPVPGKDVHAALAAIEAGDANLKADARARARRSKIHAA